MFRRAKGAYMPVLSESVLSVSVHIHCIWIAHSKCERVVHGGLWGAARQNELFGNREKMDIKLCCVLTYSSSFDCTQFVLSIGAFAIRVCT